MSKSKGQSQVEFLRSVIASGGTIAKASFSSERGPGPGNPTYMLALDQRGALMLQELSWTQELEEYLLHEHPTRMAVLDEERDRFANIIDNNLRALEARFGRDYTQAVFVEVVAERPEYDLQRLLKKVPLPKPSRESVAYQDCRLLVEHAITGLQNTAILSLRYPNGPETVRLIGEAIGLVLDERFHVSLREQFFQG
jgi:hypothetical protein